MDMEYWAIGNLIIALIFTFIGLLFDFPRWGMIFLFIFMILFILGAFDIPV